MNPVVMNRIGRDLSLFVSPQRLSGVRVRIKARIVRTADVNRDAMTLVEDQARRPEIYLELIDPALLHEDLVVKSLTEARSNCRIEHQPFAPIRIDVNEFGHKVSIGRVTLSPQFYCYATRHLDRRLQHRRGKFQNVLSLAYRPLVHRSLF